MSDHAFAEQCSNREQEQFRLAQNNAIVSQKTGTLNAMHQAYILAKQDIALANFPEMIAGVEGFYITDDLQAKLNIGSEEYRNHVMCQEFVICLGEILKEELVSEIVNSPCYAVGVDESTDQSTTEELIFYVRFLNAARAPVARFWGMKALDQANAATITAVILDTLGSAGLSLDQLFAFGSDGASVMTGCENGVSARLREVMPYLLSFHCLAHKLSLCCNDAGSDIPFFQSFDSTLHAISSYFTRSAKRSDRFTKIQKELGFDTIGKVVKDVETRWLSKGLSVESVYATLPALEEEFREQAAEGNEVASMLHNQVTSVTFLGTLCFYRDILSKLNLLSKCFQGDTIDFESVTDLISATRLGLEALYTKPAKPGGVTLKAFLRAADSGDLEKDDTFQFPHPRGTISVVRSSERLSDLFKHIKLYAAGLFSELGERFPSQELTGALDIFSPAKFPRDITAVADYGDEKLQTLIDHYCECHQGSDVDAPVLDADAVRLEWDALKLVMSEKKIWESTFTDFWVPFLLKDDYPNCMLFLGASILEGAMDVDTDVQGDADPTVTSTEQAATDPTESEMPGQSEDEEMWCDADFECPNGWEVQNAPPDTVTHKVSKKAAKIAHRFSDKWYIGKFRYISQTGSEKGLKGVFYSDDGLLYFHSLLKEEYGVKGKWVILRKEPKKKGA
ncbi:hypothetical protein CYMTET_25316 [Cymbomonas tetramitiformis]|uniref:DUF4371 domain-containing protein n=1 Tax=Cymbomonas tetramitiformis TaxID=36881 RepID=A0AAE0FUP9_9CHLO|nr:hypothetical protein CYMTET_25316 [Cymbomonas tetramitiformis]